MADRVKHLISPLDCLDQPVPLEDQQWTWCGRLRYHVEPQPKQARTCAVCKRARKKAGYRA